MSSLTDTVHPFWQARDAARYVTPQDDRWPEGPLLGPVLQEVCTGFVVEIGCGDGRLARLFPYYIGVEPNPQTLMLAQQQLAGRRFERLAEPLPDGYTALLCNVFMHIRDEDRNTMVDNIDKYDRIVIAEVMERHYRDSSVIPCFNRDREEYYALFAMRKARWWTLWCERYQTSFTILALDR